MAYGARQHLPTAVQSTEYLPTHACTSTNHGLGVWTAARDISLAPYTSRVHVNPLRYSTRPFSSNLPTAASEEPSPSSGSLHLAAPPLRWQECTPTSLCRQQQHQHQ